MGWDLVALHDGRLLTTHGEGDCAGPSCCVHRPSSHHMLAWPQSWRQDRGLMERVCPHGVGHPDPDDLAFRRSVLGEDAAWGWGVHGCDGCCHPPAWAGEAEA